MIVITSGKDCNHYAKSFRRVGTIIMIIFQNHCNHFFKQSKLMIFFIEFHSLNVLFWKKHTKMDDKMSYVIFSFYGES